MSKSRHNTFRNLVLFAVLMLISCGQVLNAVSLGSEIKNGDFEKNSSGMPEDWHVEDKIKGNGKIEVAITEADKQALRLLPNKNNAGKDLLGVGQLLDAKKYRGKTISVQADLAASGSARAVVGFHVLGQSEFVQLSQGENESKLARQEDQLKVSDKAENIVVYAIVTGTSGTAFFDNIGLRIMQNPAAAAIDYSAAQEALSAKLAVDLGDNIRVVPDSLLGANIEWINNSQGLWSTKLNGLEPQVIDLTRDMGVTLLRFPGGAWSDYYFWRNGIGDHAKRPVSLHNPGGHKSANNFGTDEALEFARLTNSKLFVTVNAGHGTAQLAADWVEYINKTKKGGVKWWEIGNELYMNGDFSGADFTAKRYADKVVNFAKAMRKVDPEIKIGAIGGLNYGRYAFVRDEHWNKTVLSRVAGEIDFLAVHNAYAPVLIGADASTDSGDAYRAMLAAPVNISNNFKDLDDQLGKYERDGKTISIAVTEWGPMFHFHPNNPWVDHIKTLGSSLFVSSTLHTFLRHPRVEVATQFKLTDLGFMGWIGNRGADFIPTAPYLAFQFYKDIGGGTVVGSNVDVATFDSKSLGVVDAVKNVPFLDTLAIKKDKDLMLFVINKHFSKPIDTVIDLAGQADFANMQVKTLTGTAMDAHTGTHPPEIPGIKWAKQVELGRFSKGGDKEITVTENLEKFVAQKSKNSLGFSYLFPPRSLTRIILRN